MHPEGASHEAEAESRSADGLVSDHRREPAEDTLGLPLGRAAPGWLANALGRSWWADPAVALVIAAVAVTEGRDS